MAKEVLVLNLDYRPLSFLPLSTIDWQSAIKLMIMNRVAVVHEYEDWEVHSPSMTMKVPSVVIVKSYMKYSRTVRFSRKNLFMRDLYTCQYCGDIKHDSELNIDHVIPRAKGGKTSWTNCVTSCIECNAEKADRIIAPKRLPFKPELWHLMANNHYLKAEIKHHTWLNYVQI